MDKKRLVLCVAMADGLGAGEYGGDVLLFAYVSYVSASAGWERRRS